MLENNELLTAVELQELLKCSLVTIRRLTSSGYLPYIKLGPRMVRYQRHAIENALGKCSTLGRKSRVPEVVLPIK